MAQITSVTSELLQAEIRRLLPSQQGFGEDLQASNVIIPIIDLTGAASGSDVRADLQTASGLTNTHFNVSNTTTSVLTGTGFFLFNYTFIGSKPGSANVDCRINVTDGTTTTIIRQMNSSNSLGANFSFVTNDEVVIYLNSGESVTVSAIGTYAQAQGSYRQIANSIGNLVNPTGFTPE